MKFCPQKRGRRYWADPRNSYLPWHLRGRMECSSNSLFSVLPISFNDMATGSKFLITLHWYYKENCYAEGKGTDQVIIISET